MSVNLNVPLDPNYCAIAFLGDTSGSMASFNIKEFAQSVTDVIRENSEKFEVVFYGATFSDKFNIFADGVNGADVTITKEDLEPRGLTALVPALGRLIKHVGSRLNDMTERRPSKVIFITLTDGEQTVAKLTNSIPEDMPYEGRNGLKNLRNLVDEHKNTWKWSFMFMGTGIDSITTGSSLGFSKNQCINFGTHDNGIQNVMRCVSNNVYRTQTSSHKATDDELEGFNDDERFASMVDHDASAIFNKAEIHIPDPADPFVLPLTSPFTTSGKLQRM